MSFGNSNSPLDPKASIQYPSTPFTPVEPALLPTTPPTKQAEVAHGQAQNILSANTDVVSPEVHGVKRERFQDLGDSEKASAVKDQAQKTEQVVFEIKVGLGTILANFFRALKDGILDLWDWSKTPEKRMANFTPEQRQEHMNYLVRMSKHQDHWNLAEQGVFRVESQKPPKLVTPVIAEFAHRKFTILRPQVDSLLMGSLFKKFIKSCELLKGTDPEKTQICQRNFLEAGRLIRTGNMLKEPRLKEDMASLEDGAEAVKDDKNLKEGIITTLQTAITHIDPNKQKIFYQLLDTLNATAIEQNKLGDQGMTIEKLTTMLAPNLYEPELDSSPGAQALEELQANFAKETDPTRKQEIKVQIDNKTKENQRAAFELPQQINAALQFILKNRKTFPTPPQYSEVNPAEVEVNPAEAEVNPADVTEEV